MKHETKHDDRFQAGHDKSANSALARGLAILAAFSAHRPALSARDLMALTGLPRPTLFRLTATLCQAGLLRYDEADGRFMPAPRLAQLAAPMSARTPIRQLAFGPMQALADRACGQVSLGLGLGHDLILVELAQSRECMTVRPAVGSRISLSRTASGRAYLGALPAAQVEHDLDELARARPGYAPILRARLEEARREMAEHGFCVSLGDLNEQIHSVAVPLRPLDGADEIYVFACAVPRFELEPGQLLDDIGPRLLALARSIEAALGLPVFDADSSSMRARTSPSSSNLPL